MTTLRHLISGFLGGELDPLMHGRVDTDQYQYGLERCENFVCVNEGPIVKRPGFVYVQDARPGSKWLSAFRFSITQEYVVEWGNYAARFFTNGLPIENAPGVPYEIATPYTAFDAPQLSFQQSFDRLYIDHRNYPPAALVRTGALTFTHQVSELVNGPFADQNTNQGITVTVNTTAGLATISASHPIFRPGHVNTLFRIETIDFSNFAAWSPGMTNITIGFCARSEGKVYQAVTAGTTGSITPTHTEGTELDGTTQKDVNDKGPYGVKWTYLHDRFGIVRIELVSGDGTWAQGTVLRRIPEAVVSKPTYRWSYQAFSADAGWPSIVAHWQGRQIHIKDFEVIGSVVGDFGGGRVNFQQYATGGATTPDLAFRRVIATDNPPHWAVPDRRLVVGTPLKELAIGPVNSQLALTGDNIQAEPQSVYGSEPVPPVQMGTELVFVERGGRRLRASDYDFARDRYAAPDLTSSARHVTESGIIQLAFERSPFSLLHAVRADGQIAVHAHTRLEVKGFSRIVLGGNAMCLSAVSVVGADDKTDELWILVERWRGASLVREIWRQSRWREVKDNQYYPAQAFFVDAGVERIGNPGQTTFTGLNHLAGQPVAVLCHGGVIPGLMVDHTGTLTLPVERVPPNEPFFLNVGLAYTAIATTLRPEARTGGGTLQGLVQRVVKGVLRVLQTMGTKLGPPEGPHEEMFQRTGDMQMDMPIPLFTGDVSTMIDAAHDRTGRVSFISSRPLPATLNSAVFKIDADAKDA